MATRRPLVAIGGDICELPAADTVPNLPQTLQTIVPVVGGSFNLDGSAIAILLPLAALASSTLNLPANPVDGQVIRVTTMYTISTLTVSPGSGKSIVGAPSSITTTTPFGLVYRAANTTWYRI
ncbi:hypothetical protein MKK84_19560 [Methylobacterium sp. E-065]|uniref:hypothetical protein n=1 Tax=Methylobacterium sp. E-065 TaxID=2836583 RepID=UPI001FB8E282|nr:hypothetical protein [Methylobacterium sp. E-065]MCJ2019604.1 hypothetical protein [Methylobacterium sp. E-065]